MTVYLRQYPPKRSQFRSPRRRTPTGLTVIHTAESVVDNVGPDSGAETVAVFIRNRKDPGSYHDLVDSDSVVQLVEYGDEAYQDGTGSNPYALSISFALRAEDWPTLTPARRAAFLAQGARAFARQQAWLRDRGYPTTPLRRITRAESERGKAGFISHGDRDPGRRSDPGKAFPWGEFFAACETAISAKTTTSQQPPAPPAPPVHREIDMLIVLDADDTTQYVCTATTARHITLAERQVYLAAGVPYVGKDQAPAESRTALISALLSGPKQ